MQPSSGKVAGGRTSNRNTELALPGIILGVGLCGFADGILLHQLLQWHHLLSSTDTDNAAAGSGRLGRCGDGCCWAGGCSTWWRA
jgi:uncharacterized membrane protein